MTTLKHNLKGLKKVGDFPMPEKSSNLNVASWFPVVQDKDVELQAMDVQAIAMQEHNKLVYERLVRKKRIEAKIAKYKKNRREQKQ